ncbi:MAG: carbohydrate binding family 9 domain-containing protein [Bryobacterales bacterium]|nr:carbohydrate binding family 9 domain-containing protein [Bryobacterales bacterium]
MPIAFRLPVCLALAALCFGQPEATRQTKAIRASERIRIDGVLNEKVWTEHPGIGPLVQQDPHPGGEPSEATETRIAYNGDAIFIAVFCRDSRAKQVRGTQMQRDGSLVFDDYIQILLDTRRDRRNAYYFATNPAGVMVDGTISENNTPNLNWDGIWHVRTRMDADGWTAEMEIPLKTIAFAGGVTTWGFNIGRRIARAREESRWTSSNLDSEFFLVARAGELNGLENLSHGIGLDVRPYVLGGFSRDISRPDRNQFARDAGADIFYRLTPNLVSVTSFNTDFAETEVDTRQINLTRFPLLFPEHRQFFLEDAGIFEFAASPGTRDFTPYFSRSIGLVGGEEVPIDFGQKVTGKIGRFDVGLMDVKTRNSPVAPARNFLVARTKANFWSQSYLGALLTNGEPTGETGNTQFGVDLKIATANLFNKGKNFRSLFYGSQTATPGRKGDDRFWGGEVVYPNDLLYVWYRWRFIGQNYYPALGFMRRTGVRESATGFNFRPRPNFWNMRQTSFRFYYTGYFNSAFRQVESRKFYTTPFEVEFKSGERFIYHFTPTFERLFQPFNIHKGVSIPTGAYWFHRHEISFETADNRPLAFKAKTETGSFYSGRSHEASPQLVWRKDDHLTTSFELQQYWVNLAEGAFRTRLALFRINYSFNPSLTLANFIQYDTDSRNLGLQSRVRWMIRPGNELFLVVNHAWQYNNLDRFEAVVSNVRAKLNYTFRF